MVSRRLQAGSGAVVVAAIGVEGVLLLRDWDFFAGEEDAARDVERLVVGNKSPVLGRRDLPIPLSFESSSSSLRFRESVEREREGDEAAVAAELLVALGGVYEYCSSLPLKVVGTSSSSSLTTRSEDALPRREFVSSFIFCDVNPWGSTFVKRQNNRMR